MAQSEHVRSQHHRGQVVDRQRRRDGHHQPQDEGRVPSQVLPLFVLFARAASQSHRHHHRRQQRRSICAQRHVD